MRTTTRTLGRMILWGMAAACVGLFVNLFHPHGVAYVGSPFPPVVEDPEVPFPELLPIENGHELVTSQDALFVDARSRRRFDRGHVRGAVSLPWIEFEKQYHESIPELVKRPLIVVYDEDSTDSSARELGRKLIEDGFPAVYRLAGGFDAWTIRGYPADRLP